MACVLPCGTFADHMGHMLPWAACRPAVRSMMTWVLDAAISDGLHAAVPYIQKSRGYWLLPMDWGIATPQDWLVITWLLAAPFCSWPVPYCRRLGEHVGGVLLAFLVEHCHSVGNQVMTYVLAAAMGGGLRPVLRYGC